MIFEIKLFFLFFFFVDEFSSNKVEEKYWANFDVNEEYIEDILKRVSTLQKRLE